MSSQSLLITFSYPPQIRVQDTLLEDHVWTEIDGDTGSIPVRDATYFNHRHNVYLRFICARWLATRESFFHLFFSAIADLISCLRARYVSSRCNFS